MRQRYLQTFITLADTLHFGRTSELHHMTPPTLTRVIQRFEEEVGHALFERDKRKVFLTDAGKSFYQYAKQSVALWEELQLQLNPDIGDLHGTLKICCQIATAYTIVPAYLKAFHKDYPNITVNIETDTPDIASAKLDKGVVDFVFAMITDERQERFDTTNLMLAELVMVQPKDDYHKGSVTKKDLESFSFILPGAGPIAVMIKDWFKEQKVLPNMHSYVSSHEAVLSLVATGMGTGIIPKMLLDYSHLKDDVKVIDVPTPLPSAEVGLFMREQLHPSPIQLLFRDYVREQISSRPVDG